uniref:Calcineurinlike phosphoesterase putative n=1 Tax=Albugo laibachii Nc14 TaxID=890382 RepID=F0WIS7_9STRA|nr:calcineurinlike phosphoesterase putative [Albugo laibachii Nc14]|eukprot:CCA21171.1 calcineurinlike phosphoesterase putative [Albugo laibachii Nc14]
MLGCEPLCSRSAKSAYILHFSDIHLKPANEGSTPVLDYGSDPPLELLKTALRFAQELKLDPKIFLYTGDSVVHELKDGNTGSKYVSRGPEHLLAVVKDVIKELYHFDGFKKNTIGITTIIGNADSTPNYYMKISDGTTENPTLGTIAPAWNGVISKAEKKDLEERGYTSKEIDERLVVLTLNTTPYSGKHDVHNNNPPGDPFQQFAWLSAKLKQAQENGKFVYICGHIPPVLHVSDGAYQWKGIYIETYKTILKQYKAVVKAQIFGHVHGFEIRPFDVPLFTVGAISPVFKGNPTFVVWEYSKETYEFLDYHVYGSRMAPFDKWEFLFSATTEYQLKNLSANEVNRLPEMFNENPRYFTLYLFNKWAKSSEKAKLNCQLAECKATVACSFRWDSVIAERHDCVKKRTAFYETEKESPLLVQERLRRLLQPISESSIKKNPDSSITWICATIFLAVLLLGLVIFALGRIMRIKALWMRLVKGGKTERAKTMRLIR